MMKSTYIGILSSHTMHGITGLFMSSCEQPVASIFQALRDKSVTVIITNIDKPLSSDITKRTGVVKAHGPQDRRDSGSILIDNFNVLSLLKSHIGSRVTIEIEEHPTMDVCMVHPVMAQSLNTHKLICATPKALLDYVCGYGVPRSGVGTVEIIESTFKMPNWLHTYQVFVNGYPVAYCNKERLEFSEEQ